MTSGCGVALGGSIRVSFSVRGGAGSVKTRTFPLEVVCWASAAVQVGHNRTHETQTRKKRRYRRGIISRIRPEVGGTAMFGGAHSNVQERKNKESTRIPNCRASGAQLTRQVQTRATAGEALRIANDAINFSSSSSRRTRLFVEDEHEDDNAAGRAQMASHLS